MSNRIPKKLQTDIDDLKAQSLPKEGISTANINEAAGTGTVSLNMTARQVTIETLSDSLSQHGVDVDVWMVDRWLTNDWSVTMGKKRSGTGRAETYMNVQVKVWLKRRIAEPVEHIIKRFIADTKKHAPKYKPFKRAKKAKSGNVCEINPADIHLGLRAWSKETLRSDYDTDIACDMVREGMVELVALSEPFHPERYLFIVGNDFYNADNLADTTTAGTAQDVDGRWHKTFSRGRRLAVACIDMLLQHAPVDIIVMPGNHDEQSAHALGAILQAWYRNVKDVNIDNEPAKRKYYEWGKCLIGFAHGKDLKAKDLPMLMAQDNRPEAWQNTKYAEWHLAHLHQVELQDIGGVRIRRIASPSPLSAWASSKGFESQREMQAYVWHTDKGNIARLSWIPNN